MIPYSSFIGPNDFTYCFEGHSIDRSNYSVLFSCITYGAASEANANRIRLTNNKLNRKVIVDGTRGEEGRFAEDARILETLRYLYLDNKGQRMIGVPDYEIVEVYDPFESLRLLTEGQIKNFPEDIYCKIITAKRFFVNYGIKPEDIGIYGGFQTFLIHYRNANRIKDIDLIIKGIENYDLIKTLAKRSGFESPDSREAEVNQMIRERRHSLSRVVVDNGLFCDIKIIRRESDDNSFDPNVQITGRDVTFRGTVINAQESLCVPMSFKITTGDRNITVGSARYNFLASVDEGDFIEITGAETDKEDYVLLSDTRGHDIKYGR